MRFLGIDYGTKRIGLAVAEGPSFIAVPRGHVINDATSLKKISDFCRNEKVARVVIGLPLTLRGEEGRAAGEVRLFADKLALAAGISVDYIDERLTTKILPKSGIKDKDAASAAVILQDFLDRENYRNKI